MKKRTVRTMCITIVAIVATAMVVVYLFFGNEPFNKVISIKGYDIIVPKDRIAADEGTLTDKDETGDGVAAGTVLYSGTISVSYNTLVTHPKTGKKVQIGPIAEKWGFSSYLEKPITVTVKKRDTNYVATATCDGKTLVSQTYTSLWEAQKVVHMIQAYGG